MYCYCQNSNEVVIITQDCCYFNKPHCYNSRLKRQNNITASITIAKMTCTKLVIHPNIAVMQCVSLF